MLLWCLHFIVQMFVMNSQLIGSGNQTYMELQNRIVGLRQQVKHSHHAEIPIQNSQSHSKCTPVCNKS